MSSTGPLLPLTTLHELFGTLLAGTWINAMLFALEISQVYRYFATFKRDIAWIRVLVVTMFTIDIVSTSAVCGLAYTYLVTGWGDLVEMQHQNVMFPIWVCTSSCVIFLMHGFLIERYRILSKNLIVSAILYLPVLTALCGGMIVTWAVGVKYTQAEDRPKQRTFVTVWQTGAVVADIMIALALIFELGRVKTSFENTKGLIRRLIRSTIMSGSFTAFLALASLIIFLASPQTNTCLIFTLGIGRVSTLTVLFNLNERKSGGSLRTSGRTSDTASVPLESRAQNNGRTAHGISVHQVSVVHAEGNGDRKSRRDGEGEFEETGSMFHSAKGEQLA